MEKEQETSLPSDMEQGEFDDVFDLPPKLPYEGPPGPPPRDPIFIEPWREEPWGSERDLVAALFFFGSVMMLQTICMLKILRKL